jgi:hypothetical protein
MSAQDDDPLQLPWGNDFLRMADRNEKEPGKNKRDESSSLRGQDFVNDISVDCHCLPRIGRAPLEAPSRYQIQHSLQM